MPRFMLVAVISLFTLAAGSAWAGAGGPDAFGYSFVDSAEAAGPSYSWDDIVDPGNLLATVASSDDEEEPVDLSFSFPFYGTSYDRIMVSSNGAVFFDEQDFSFSNNCLPSTTEAHAFIAAYWDDLNPSDTLGAGDIYFAELGSAPERRAVIQWNAVKFYSSDDIQSFQIVLHESGVVELRYAELGVFGDNATVGIQKDDTTALEYSCNAPALARDMVIQYACTVDEDGDGATCAYDCDDTDPAIHPGAPEVCDGVDSNCDGIGDTGIDLDGDGVDCTLDCDDSDPTNFPGNLETCDGSDEDCDGLDDGNDMDIGASPGPVLTGTASPAAIIDATEFLASSEVVVDQAGRVNGVRVSVDITHSWGGDLIITLVSPAGTAVVLSNGRGGSGDGFAQTVFDDAAEGTITGGIAPFTGSFQPEEPLEILLGEDTVGTWVLRVEDSYPAADNGTFDHWEIEIETLAFDDADEDGWIDSCGDCDGTRADVNPNAVEVCDDTLDNDCDGYTDATDSDCGGSGDDDDAPGGGGGDDDDGGPADQASSGGQGGENAAGCALQASGAAGSSTPWTLLGALGFGLLRRRRSRSQAAGSAR